MLKVISMFGMVAVLVSVTGCGGIIAGRNVRMGRDKFADAHNCPKKEVKATNAGKVVVDDPPDGLMGANKVAVEGCGATEEYLCATFDTGGGGSDVRCK